MEEQDLREIGITDPGHRRKIVSAARSLPKVCVGSKINLHAVSISVIISVVSQLVVYLYWCCAGESAGL